MIDTEIAVFARLPVPGKVKTRLASGTGSQRAARFYKACAEHIFRESSKCAKARAIVHCSEQSEVPGVRDWIAEAGLALQCVSQVDHQDLGVRMHTALAFLLAQQDITKAIVIGTDIPDISASVLSQAVHALDTHQIVIGPALDGGYYLLGCTVAPKELFQGIEWSTNTVFQQTVQKAQELQLNVAPAGTLPRLQDIDTLQDLQHWHDSASQDQISEHPVMPVINSILRS